MTAGRPAYSPSVRTESEQKFSLQPPPAVGILEVQCSVPARPRRPRASDHRTPPNGLAGIIARTAPKLPRCRLLGSNSLPALGRVVLAGRFGWYPKFAETTTM